LGNNIKNISIIVLAPTTSQPRYHKRVSQISKYFRVKVFAFNRGLYEQNIFPDNISLIRLGEIADRKYLRRVLQLIKAIFIVRRELRGKQKSIFYAFSIDCVIIAKLAGLRDGYLEVGDLILPSGIGKYARVIERNIIKNIFGVFLTSEAFYWGHYQNLSKHPEWREKFHIIENRVTPSLIGTRPGSRILQGTKITIGVIGLLRYKKPLELIVQYVKKHPKMLVLDCYGDGPLRQYIQDNECENIHYYGSFKNPDDLPSIYSKIDINYVAYDNKLVNVKLAIPNKLFESGFFGVPIICSEHTELGSTAIKWGIGKVVSIEDENQFSNDIRACLKKPWINQAAANCLRLKAVNLVENGEIILEQTLKTDFSATTLES
jgi:succinoglycan biosynthesis protein ExoL